MEEFALNEIDVRSMTTHRVAPDGSVICLNFENAGGRPMALRLPSLCVAQLLMTLPRLLSKALQAQHGDGSLRVAFPLGDWRLGTAAASKRPLLAMRSPDRIEWRCPPGRPTIAPGWARVYDT